MVSRRRRLPSLLLSFPSSLFGQPRLQGLFSLDPQACLRGALRFQASLACSSRLGPGGSL